MDWLEKPLYIRIEDRFPTSFCTAVFAAKAVDKRWRMKYNNAVAYFKKRLRRQPLFDGANTKQIANHFGV